MSFTYDDSSFYLDGRPFTVYSGAIHYWRVPRAYWADRLKKLRAAGLNTVETYVPWNLHEPAPGTFDFSGELDLEAFLSLASGLGLKAIVRPGPYICAEFESGGLPAWLFRDPLLRIRCNDERYFASLTPYLREVFRRLTPFFTDNGGPVIMVQLENEYGSYGDDKDYLRRLLKLYRDCGVGALIYTSDGSDELMLSGGTLPELPAVVNFGSHAPDQLKNLRRFHPGQPAMCGELWCGWFDHWGAEHHGYDPVAFRKVVGDLLAEDASFNIYMFHGGTNFGFTSGANYEEAYEPTVTSYDYSAPVTEAGDLSPLFYILREMLAEKTGVTPPMDVQDLEKAAYAPVKLTERALLFEQKDALGASSFHPFPPTMEQMGQDFGYLLYSTECESQRDVPLILPAVSDRAWVYQDGEFAGRIDRDGETDKVLLKGKPEKFKVDILTENRGRINYGPKTGDPKGLLALPKLSYRQHFGYLVTPLPMDELSGLSFSCYEQPAEQPAFYRGRLTLASPPKDTFVRVQGLTRGFLTVNGRSLGRFENDLGPQKTLYCPAPWLKEGENEFVVFSCDKPEEARLVFSEKPELG